MVVLLHKRKSMRRNTMEREEWTKTIHTNLQYQVLEQSGWV